MLLAFRHIVEVARHALPRWFNSWRLKTMLGVQHGVQRSVDADRRRVRLLVTAAFIILSKKEQW